jgi:biotin carboxylase
MKATRRVFLYFDHQKAPFSLRTGMVAAAKRRGWDTVLVLHRENDDAKAQKLEVDDIVYVADWTSHEVIRVVNSYYLTDSHPILMCHPGTAHHRFGMIGVSVAEAAAQLGIPFPSAESLYQTANKFLARQCLERAGIASVKCALVENQQQALAQAERLGYPVVLKPVFGSGSSLVARCNSAAELARQFAHTIEVFELTSFAYQQSHLPHQFRDLNGIIYNYRPGRTFLLEQYIEGQEGSVECVVSRDPIPILVHDKLILTETRFTFLENIFVTPAIRFDDDQQKAARQYATAVVRALGLSHCIVHLEFRFNSLGQPQFLECNPRLGAPLFDYSFRTVAGFDAYDILLDILSDNFAVDQIERCKPARTAGHYAMIVIFPTENGFFAGISGLEEATRLPGVLAHRVSYSRGQYLWATDEEHFVVSFWTWARDRAELEALYERISDSVKVEIV